VSLQSTAEQGDRLDTLRALRDALAADLDACESMRDKAALSLRLMDALEQIDVLEKAQPPKEASPLDEIRARREARTTGANNASGAKARRRN
jgi:hypothetical protein